MKVSLIHPSRSRPELAKKVYDEWMGKAANPDEIEYILSLDNSDPQLKSYLFNSFSDIYFSNRLSFTVNENGSAIEAINVAATLATGDLLVVVSDDFGCPQNWDVDLLNAVKGREDFIVKTWDGLQPWLITLPILDRKYYERFGFVYNPAFKHLFCDTLMTVQGDLLGKTIKSDLHFPHKHHTQKGGIPKDEVSKKNDATWSQGESVFLQAAKDGFWLDPNQVIGHIRDENMRKWLKQKGINL